MRMYDYDLASLCSSTAQQRRDQYMHTRGQTSEHGEICHSIICAVAWLEYALVAIKKNIYKQKKHAQYIFTICFIR